MIYLRLKISNFSVIFNINLNGPNVLKTFLSPFYLPFLCFINLIKEIKNEKWLLHGFTSLVHLIKLPPICASHLFIGQVWHQPCGLFRHFTNLLFTTGVQMNTIWHCRHQVRPLAYFYFYLVLKYVRLFKNMLNKITACIGLTKNQFNIETCWVLWCDRGVQRCGSSK